jgi:hypothetical protein
MKRPHDTHPGSTAGGPGSTLPSPGAATPPAAAYPPELPHAPGTGPSPPRNPHPYGPILRVCVYGMLMVSAAVTVLFGDHLWSAWREGTLAVWAPLTPPLAFTAFVVVYTIDRFLLVRRQHYPVSRALFQVAFGLVFLTLLLPQQAQELRAPHLEHLQGPEQPALLLLTHDDATVRAAACELLAGTYTAEVYETVLDRAHHDPEAAVRADCTRALERLHAAATAGNLPARLPASSALPAPSVLSAPAALPAPSVSPAP